MSRPIKFRCWDGLGNYGMQFFESLQEIADYYIGHKYQAEMQYTGLKDKTGVEIYEGDIVKYESEYGLGIQNYLVVFKNGAFIGEILDNNIESIETLNHLSYGEVVGNIYENPELLKEINDE